MKKSFLLTLLLSIFTVTTFATAKPVRDKNPFKIFEGYKSAVSSNGNSVTVYVEWNTLNPIGSRVSNVIVVDNSSSTWYTVTSWEQYPRMDLVSGGLVASGWRCNFNSPSSDYVILNGNLTMY